MTENYFNDTTYISNSQLRSFVSYNKFWQRLLTPDIYNIYHIKKAVQFEVNDAIIIWKIVDLYFEWAKDTVWTIYKPVSKRTWKADEWVVEITKKMETESLKMIEWGLAFDKFQEFINDKDTIEQNPIKTEINWVKMKCLIDFTNHKRKMIVDLKTTWSLDMIIDWLQFRWEPILTAPYIRQLAITNKLNWGWYDWALALISTKGVKWIDIPNSILEEAWDLIELDVQELQAYIKNPTSINESIFN